MHRWPGGSASTDLLNKISSPRYLMPWYLFITLRNTPDSSSATDPK